MARKTATRAEAAHKAPGDDESAERRIDAPAEPAVAETVQESPEDIVEEGIALARAIRATGICLTVRVIHGGRLPKPLDSYFSGIGGQTIYGVAFITEWRDVQPPFFETTSQSSAREIMHAIDYEKEVRWRITRVRSQASEAPDQEAESTPPTRRRPRGLPSDGLPQRDDSRKRRTGMSRRRKT